MKKSAVFLIYAVMILALGACSHPKSIINPPPPLQEETVPASTATALPVVTKIAGTPPPATPSLVPSHTPTPTEIPASPTATHAPTATPGPRYIFQAGTPLGMANFVVPEAGCNWLGVGGQVFDLNSVPVSSMVVEIGGSLGGQPVSLLTLSGSTVVFGPGGFLVQIGDRPVASDGSLWIRLGGLDGKPLTDPLYFTTYADCERNLVLINFAEVATALTPRVFLPSILREPLSP